MARAMTSPELASIRTDNQWSKIYLAVLMPNTVMTATVSTAPTDDDQVVQINITGAAWGSGYTSAIKDMLVYVGSSAGDYDKGFVRLREDLSGTPTTMKIGEISEIDWSNGDHITIVDEFPLAPRHVYIDGSSVVYMDRDLTYASQSDQHDDPDPVPVLGPALVPVWLTGSYVDVNFDASDSWTWDGSISSHSWAVQGTGISIQSGGTTATPVFRITAAGTYRVANTVTGSNGQSYTAYRYIRCYDANNMPVVGFTLEDCSGNWDAGGWSARITLHDEADLTDIRERALVALFTEDYFDNAAETMGPITDRENILMVGWVGNESINWDPEEGTVTLEIQGPQYWLGQMNGFPSGLEWVASDSTAWTDMTTLTLEKGAWHFVHWRTTLTRCTDFFVTDDTRQFSLFNASPGTLWERLTGESFATILAHPCCDRFGRLYVQEEPQVLTTAQRSSVPTVLTVTSQDLRRPANLERRTIPPVGLVDLSGIVYSGGTGSALFSLAPGHIFKWLGPGIERVDRLALSSQAQSNTLAGHYAGWRNAEYPNVSLPFACNMRMLDIAPHQYASLQLLAPDTIRGLAVTLTLVPRSVSFTHDAESGSLQTDVQAESASVEQASGDGDVPATPPDPAPPPLPSIDPIPLPGLAPEWPTNVIVATRGDTTAVTNAEIYECTDFSGPSGSQPTWTKKSGTGLPATRYGRDFNADSQDKGEDLYLLISQTSPNTDTDHELYYSSDGGDNFSKVMDNSTASTLASVTGKIFGFGVDPSNAGVIWVTFKSDTIYLGESGLLVSSNYGSTWTYYTIQSGGYQYQCVGVRGDGNDIWVGGAYFFGSGPGFTVSHDGGSSWSTPTACGSSNWDPSPQYGKASTSMYFNADGSSEGDDLAHTTSDTAYSVDRDSDNIPPQGRYRMYLSPTYAAKMWVLEDGGVSGWKIHYTDDSWSTMTSGSYYTEAASLIGWCGEEDDDEDYKRMILFNPDAGTEPTKDGESIFVTVDYGSTLTHKSGTNYETSPYTGAIPHDEGGLCGVVVIDRENYH